ncbi:MAG TPA: non-homologous end-joining DNA ligase, partial [Acidimicrobiales bacterium]|nr:non-homologous end-joining DNA ligase [Acidimicrobiales bacterium]
YPATGFTKGEVIAYYQQIAPVLLPHLEDKMLTLKRYPNGVDRDFFYEKQCPKHRPDWVATQEVYSGRNKKYIGYCVVDQLATLVWVANLASLELHTSLQLRNDLNEPRMMVFDLDPGPPADIRQCSQVAVMLRAMLDDLELKCFPKSSGSKGLQLYVPLNMPGITFDHTKALSHGLAQVLEKEHPDLVVSVMKKELRGGKVLIDWSQNDEHKTTVNVYSLRARDKPTVSTPLSWDEVEELADGRDPESVRFVTADVLARVEKMGDLFAPVLELSQTLPTLRDAR